MRDPVLSGVDSANDPFTSDCPGRTVFNHLTSRWGLLLVLALVDGPMRFHALRNRVEGISEKMLSQSLKMLARDGLVRRSVEPAVPPRVSYELTAMGREVAAPLTGVLRWIGRRMPDILAAQDHYDSEEASH